MALRAKPEVRYKSKMAAPMKGCYGATRWLLRRLVAMHVTVAMHVNVARHVTVARHVLVATYVRTRTVAMALRAKVGYRVALTTLGIQNSIYFVNFEQTKYLKHQISMRDTFYIL